MGFSISIIVFMNFQMHFKPIIITDVQHELALYILLITSLNRLHYLKLCQRCAFYYEFH